MELTKAVLVSGDVDAILQFLVRWKIHGEGDVTGIAWDLLSQLAATKCSVFDDVDNAMVAKWDKVAIIAYDEMVRYIEGRSEFQRDFHEQQAMHHRADLIKIAGPVPGDWAQDPA